MTEEPTRTARIALDAIGGGRVEVDGHDITDTVRELTLQAGVGRIPQLVLDLRIHNAETEAEVVAHIPADTAATLVALGWTPPDEGQPVDLTDPKRHDQMIKIIKAEARRDPDWFRSLLRREARIHGGPIAWSTATRATQAPRVVKVDGVLTEGDADTAHEALRQMDADPDGLKAGMVVQAYSEHGRRKWVFRCWGTDDGCDGLLSLDHSTRSSAESARDRHTAEAHREATEEQPP